MDDIDRQILTILAEDARASLKMLSAQVGLSSPKRDCCARWKKKPSPGWAGNSR